MILESSYSSYDIDGDILPLYLEYLEFPTYNELCSIEESDTANSLEILEIDGNDITSVIDGGKKTRKVSNTYGFISVFMLLLLLITVVGTVMFIIKGIGVI